MGRCGGVFPPPGVGPVRVVSGGDPATTCLWATEAVPEHSINAGPGEPAYVVAYQASFPGGGGMDAYYTWSRPDGTFDPGLHLAPDPPDGDNKADPWSTSHGGTRTDYFSFQGPSASKLMVGGSTPGELAATGAWLIAPKVVEAGAVDGQSFVADLGAPTILALWEDRADNTIEAKLQRFGPCSAPNPGGADCPPVWDLPLDVHNGMLPRLAAHADLTVDPCSHRPIVSMRTRIGSLEMLQFRSLELGGELGPVRTVDMFSIAGLPECSGPVPGQIPRCTSFEADCGPANTCLDIDPRPHTATLHRVDPVTEADRCLLYLAYDIVQDDTSHVRLKVFDITDPSLTAAEALVETFDVPKVDPADLDFLGTVVVDHFTGVVGVFFYRQEAGNPCTTTFRGYVRQPGESFVSVLVSDGTFPSTTFDPGTGGLGHYVRGARFNKPGVLFVSWSQPTPTTDPACDTCQGIRYSQAVFGAEVVP